MFLSFLKVLKHEGSIIIKSYRIDNQPFRKILRRTCVTVTVVTVVF